MKQILKTLYYGMCATLAKALSFFGWNPGPIVLMYHSVGVVGGKLSVSPDMFREHIKYLTRKRTIVGMNDILGYMERGTSLSKNAVAITIDDGYLDTYEVAFPILREHKIPFTLFLTTDLSRMPALGDLPRPTWEQVREISRAGGTIGVHGHKHEHVNEIAGDRAALQAEIGDAAHLIEKEVGTFPSVYAYAYGARDKRVPSYLRQVGIRAAFGITDGTVRTGDDPYALRRVQVDSTMSFRLFQYRASGGICIAACIKRALRR